MATAVKKKAPAKTTAVKRAPVKKVVSAKKSTAKRSTPKTVVKLFQLVGAPKDLALVDPAMVALDYTRGLDNEWRELAVFEDLLKSPTVKGADLWGALSMRFTEKTGLTGAGLLKQIADNPGHDVYFCNPYPSNESMYHNTWLQGVTEFPQFFPVVQSVFQAAGLDVSELTSVHPSSSYSRGNSFVGNAKFWAAYVTFMRKVLAAAEKKLSPTVLNVLHSKVPDPRGVYMGATYVPFVVERLFSYFMHKHGAALKAHKLSLPKCEAELNVHQRLLREMKDVAHQTKSEWMAACWVNYRNLYLGQNNSKAWCAKYLRAITPTDVRFA